MQQLKSVFYLLDHWAKLLTHSANFLMQFGGKINNNLAIWSHCPTQTKKIEFLSKTENLFCLYLLPIFIIDSLSLSFSFDQKFTQKILIWGRRRRVIKLFWHNFQVHQLQQNLEAEHQMRFHIEIRLMPEAFMFRDIWRCPSQAQITQKITKNHVVYPVESDRNE